MKKLLLIVLLLPLFAKAQDTIGLKLPIKAGTIIYERIEPVGKQKRELYINARRWFVDYFKNTRAAIQTEDRNNGLMTGTGYIQVPVTDQLNKGYYPVKFTIQVDSKNNMFRYRLYDFTFESDNANGTFPAESLVARLTGTSNTGPTKHSSRRLLENLEAAIYNTIYSLNAAMKANPDNY
jgi:hypothetical protein